MVRKKIKISLVWFVKIKSKKKYERNSGQGGNGANWKRLQRMEKIFPSPIMVALAELLAALVATASGYFVSIDAHAEECFFEQVTLGTKMGLIFEVAEGSFLDIDMEITGPNNK
ncbi:hypothetical protein EI555_005979 [Monodon monoceros]|uniref:GOLD domain-containing protein n=1 Tax=Monodon monoceros TaxID=40151 RepID=A0A4U1EY30_MONMO|nr:hypothetical protein EI555_005979 [Monodon monoceros]